MAILNVTWGYQERIAGAGYDHVLDPDSSENVTTSGTSALTTSAAPINRGNASLVARLKAFDGPMYFRVVSVGDAVTTAAAGDTGLSIDETQDIRVRPGDRIAVIDKV